MSSFSNFIKNPDQVKSSKNGMGDPWELNTILHSNYFAITIGNHIYGFQIAFKTLYTLSFKGVKLEKIDFITQSIQATTKGIDIMQSNFKDKKKYVN